MLKKLTITITITITIIFLGCTLLSPKTNDVKNTATEVSGVAA